jgi:hypothetical protein
MSGTKEGGTVLRSTMRSLGPEERKIVSSSVLGRLGHAPPGAQNAADDVFSADRYMTQWNSLSPVAKGALFDGVSPTAAKDLDALAKAADFIKAANKRMPNPAGTASNQLFGQVLTALSVGAVGAATGSAKVAALAAAPMAGLAVAGSFSKRVLTNPKAIHWLVRTTKVPFANLSRELAVLDKESQKWDAEDQDLAQELKDLLSNMDWPNLLKATAVAGTR